MFDPTVFEERRERLKKRLRNRKLPGLLVSLAANRYYLSGFELHDPQCNESAGLLVVTAKGPDILMTDPRYEDAAKRVWDGDDLFIYASDRFRTIPEHLLSRGIGSLAFESSCLDHKAWSKLSRELELEPSEGLVEDLRLIKDDEEAGLLEASCRINHRVMEHVEAVLPDFVGRTEEDLAWDLEKAFREMGAQELSFSSIVAVNENAALPHAIPGDTVIREGDHVLVDCGGRALGYCSDQTRTFWVGERPSDRFLRVRELVQKAQQASLDIIRPGLPIADAYKAARKVFEEEGEEKRFTHSLGHGIGLETHEAPGVNHVNKGEFRPGMVVTVEPGLYYPDWGGVRWEYMVLVTEDGCRVF